MGALDLVRRLLKGKSAPAADLAKALAAARDALASADAAVSNLEDGRKAAVVEGGDILAKHRAQLQQARDARDEAALLLEELEQRHATAAAAEAEERRELAYAEASKLSAAAARTFAAEYRELAEGFLRLQRTIAEARAAVVRVNGDLPQGCQPLPDPEAVVRDWPYLPRQDLKTTEEGIWSFADQPGSVIAGNAAITETGPGKGILSRDGLTYAVVRRRARRVKYLPSDLSSQGPRLSQMELPPLRAGSPTIWTPMRAESGTAILERLEQAAQRIEPVPRPERVAVEEFAVIAEAHRPT